jgi:hypothetical protein
MADFRRKVGHLRNTSDCKYQHTSIFYFENQMVNNKIEKFKKNSIDHYRENIQLFSSTNKIQNNLNNFNKCYSIDQLPRFKSKNKNE